MFYAHFLRTGKVGEAMARAASSIFGVLTATAEMGAREIQIVAAQNEFVEPTHTFEAEDLGA